MKQLELFPDFEIKDDERLYIIGNGFDIHHMIDSKYSDFKKWVQKNKDSHLVGMMDTFFSNECDFWADIENALGDYREEEITDFCEPISSDDFKYDHPGQWQAGLEDSIPTIFGEVMDGFRDAFDEWVRSIDISGIDADLPLPMTSRYLTFNYTETLEKFYHVFEKNVLHIHGSRLAKDDEFVIGHNYHRDVNEPYGDDEKLLPYQNAYSEVIGIMNEWVKDPESIMSQHKSFLASLNKCKAVCVMGLSYNDIDMPYLQKVALSVASDCKWWLYYYSKKDKEKAENAAVSLGLSSFTIKPFE